MNAKALIERIEAEDYPSFIKDGEKIWWQHPDAPDDVAAEWGEIQDAAKELTSLAFAYGVSRRVLNGGWSSYYGTAIFVWRGVFVKATGYRANGNVWIVRESGGIRYEILHRDEVVRIVTADRASARFGTFSPEGLSSEERQVRAERLEKELMT